MYKKDLRLLIKTKLKDSACDFEKASEEICKKVAGSNQFAEAEIVLGYMALSDEVNIGNLLKQALDFGKEVYIPRIIPDTSLMEFYKYSEAVEEGSYGIREPLPQENPQLQLEEIAERKVLMLVPGRAFDATGNRLGRGKGFYDIYISRLKKACSSVMLAGICFDLQLIQNIPAEEHDIKMDCVISEKSVTNFCQI